MHHPDRHHSHHAHHGHPEHRTPGLNSIAFWATLHCLSGCAVGEVLGMVIGTALGWGTVATIALAVVLAFLFGYALTLLPLVRRHGRRSGVAAFLGQPGVLACGCGGRGLPVEPAADCARQGPRGRARPSLMFRRISPANA